MITTPIGILHATLRSLDNDWQTGEVEVSYPSPYADEVLRAYQDRTPFLLPGYRCTVTAWEARPYEGSEVQANSAGEIPCSMWATWQDEPPG